MTRAEARAWIRHTLPTLQIGDTAAFNLPDGQPGNRIAYQTVNSVAHATLGPRRYRLKALPGVVAVTRLSGT